MKWILILIALESADPVATSGGDYVSMMDCFAAREYVMEHNRAEAPAQAVCVRTLNGRAVKAHIDGLMPR